MNTAALIVNGKSRRGREWFQPAAEALREQGFELTVERLTTKGSEMSRLVADAVAQRVPLICVGGGDGTLGAVANRFVGGESVLGIVPTGTGNAFARDLGIPINLDGAIQLLGDGVPTRVDIGDVDGTCFVNIATVGLTTLIAENLDSGIKKRFGRLAYVGALFRALAKGKRFNAKVHLADQVLEFRSMQIVVGSGRSHGGPFPVTPDAGVTTGLLAGYSVNTSRKGVLFRYALRLWLGRHVEMEEVVPFTGKQFRIETLPTRKITLDGESRQRTPGEFKVLAGAIQVIVPSPEPVP